MMAQFDQMVFNQQVVDVLDQMLQELRRQREGKTLSNIGGIHDQVLRLVSILNIAQVNRPHPLQIGD